MVSLRQPVTDQSEAVALPERSHQLRKRFSFWQLWNMSFGFFGVQFGWSLQMANTSGIFEHLGANAHQLPLLWLAAPMTGLIVQPIIGYMSDHTWGPLGRRRPYFLGGAIAGSIALVLMPNVPSLWMAVGLLWILDTSVNISMTPFRSFVGDLLPKDQRAAGFTMQSLLHGLAWVVAAALPWLMHHVFGVVKGVGQTQAISLTVKLSFYVGAAVLLSSVIWTIVTTQEHPPIQTPPESQPDPDSDSGNDFGNDSGSDPDSRGMMGVLSYIFTAFKEMPLTMRQLAWVQFFSWFGMFCLFLYFPPAIAHNILGATDRSSLLYADGIEWAGLCIAMFNAICFVFSFLLPKLVKAVGCQTTHMICLLCGAAGLISLMAIHNQYLVLLSMVGVGLAWASMLSLPYAMLVGSIPPDRRGLYMGIFNFFIVLPEIVASLGLGWVMVHVLHENRLAAVVMGGVFMMVSALLTPFVQVGSTITSANSSSNELSVVTH